MNALNVLCAQLTRDLFATAKFLYSPRALGTPLSEVIINGIINIG